MRLYPDLYGRRFAWMLADLLILAWIYLSVKAGLWVNNLVLQLDALAHFGLERIEAEGKRFDPHYHQAIERVESVDHEDGTVLEVLRQGYKLREKVLRPATVRVAVHPAGTAPKPQRRANGGN